MTERWAADPARRTGAGGPEDLAFTTEPDLAAAQILRLAAAGLRFGWVAGDEVYGRSSRLRATCDELGLTGVFIVPTTFTITTPAGTGYLAAELLLARSGADAIVTRGLVDRDWLHSVAGRHGLDVRHEQQ